MKKGDIVRLKIEDISHEGQGIGKADGFAVFVKNTVLGDVVDAELTKVKKNYAFGKVVEMVEESDLRQEPICQYAGQCGGCAFQKMSYEGQLQLKRKQIVDKLVRLGGLEDPKVNDAMGMEEPFRYRNKASMPVSTGGLITRKGGIVEPVHEPRIGFYQAKSHDVVNCDDCMLQSEPAMAAARALRQFMEEDNITSYDPRWEKGLMRHMIVRTAMGTGQVMVILVINGKGIPNAAKLIQMLDDAIFEVPVYEEGPLAGVEFSLESVVVNVNKKNTSDILGEECITLAGSPTIMEKVGDLEFEISPLSFYQVNPQQMEKLYGKVVEYADLKGGETVLDLYCGVGSIGLFLANDMRNKGDNTGRVIGIESVKPAVLDANRNAVVNGIVNARYVCGKAEEEMPKMVSGEGLKDESLRITQADVVILDPPRAGCEEELLKAVVEVDPAKIVYVSCDPATLARDIKFLVANGYEFVEATPCDMFPWTGHCEVVSLLQRV
ncbi:MAG: 23S rRNA (uracil(1939)-C(5))-methyltransferase RlmD [Firmicutes bacterium]|nr:23S rRNA (uracil(1939)-C(5))-methyltransferase RlmD [Bacillota bacterium]